MAANLPPGRLHAHGQDLKMGRSTAKRVKRERAVLDLDRHVPYFFTNISIRLSRGASKTYLQMFGIGITEWRVIASLGAIPGCGANQICQAVGLDKSAVSRSLKTLETSGYVDLTEDPDDTRFQKIALTGAGHDLHDRILQVALKREGILLSCLSRAETEILITILRKMRVQVGVVNAFDPTQEDVKPAKAKLRKRQA